MGRRTGLVAQQVKVGRPQLLDEVSRAQPAALPVADTRLQHRERERYELLQSIYRLYYRVHVKARARSYVNACS